MGETNVRVKEVHDQMVCEYWQIDACVILHEQSAGAERCGELRLTFAPIPKPKAAAGA